MKEFVKKASRKISKLSDEQVEQLIDVLNEENDTFDSIMESLSSGLVIVDENWHLMQKNKASERILPFKHHSAEGAVENVPVWELVNDVHISDFLKKCCKEQKLNVSEEFSFSLADKIHFVNVSVLPLVQRKCIVGSIITADDITEKRHQEILLHRMESLASLTNLAASVAHEIKNPLGAISIHIQLLQKSIKKARGGDGMLPDPKFMENYLDVVNEEIDALNKIVLDFLFAVRPVQATMQLVEPDSVLTKIAEFFRPEFESKGVKLVVRTQKCCPRILMDEKLFREVITNLAQNALAAIQERFPVSGGPGASVSEENVSGAQNMHGELVLESFVKNEKYILTVADNGCGMDEKTAGRIFEPYYTTKANGTGLGLTMVYKIIKEFRGDINVTSVPMHGTVFTITLPVPQKATQLLADR